MFVSRRRCDSYENLLPLILSLGNQFFCGVSMTPGRKRWMDHSGLRRCIVLLGMK